MVTFNYIHFGTSVKIIYHEKQNTSHYVQYVFYTFFLLEKRSGVCV